MATPLDLQEQEQLDALKAFWKQYGNLITWLLIAALAAYAALNGWRWWQRDQAAKAGAMFEQLEVAAQAGDAQRTGQIFADLKERYARTAFAGQGALLAAHAQFDKGQIDAATASLRWAADNASETGYQVIARLRLAGLLMQAKQYDAALAELDKAQSPEFVALVADRRGDVLVAQGKPDAARDAYQVAWKGMDERLEYRQLVAAKLTALGAPPDMADPLAAKASDSPK